MAAFSGTVLLLVNVVLLALDLWLGSDQLFRVLVLLDLMYLILFMAILSVYAARIYKDGIKRPVFVIDWRQSIYDGPKEELVSIGRQSQQDTSP